MATPFRTCFRTQKVHGKTQFPLNISGAIPEIIVFVIVAVSIKVELTFQFIPEKVTILVLQKTSQISMYKSLVLQLGIDPIIF